MEIAFWQGFLVLSILAAIFVVWPTIIVRGDRKSELRTDGRTEANEEIYKEQIKELESTHASGEIGAEEMEALRKDLERTYTSELTAADLETDKPIVANFRSRLPVLALVLAFPVLSLVIYSFVGAKPDWDIYRDAMSRIGKSLDDRQATNEVLLTQLQQRLTQKPKNIQNWYLLASVALEQGDYDEAVRAYRRLLDIEPRAAKVIAELAQALFLRAGNTITPEVRQNTESALKLDPSLPTALGLAGIDAYQSGAYQSAIDSWMKALRQLDPQSQASQVLSEGIARAQIALKQAGDTKSDSKKAEKASNIKISVSVSLDAKKVEAKPDDQVFIYARAWQGPKMPLAIQKVTVKDLPKKLVLDQSMAMAPGMDLSSFPQVELVARISQSGSAIPESGDWQVTAGPIILAEQKDTVKLLINEQVP